MQQSKPNIALLCVGQCAWCQGYNGKKNTTTTDQIHVLMEYFWEKGRQQIDLQINKRMRILKICDSKEMNTEL